MLTGLFPSGTSLGPDRRSRLPQVMLPMIFLIRKPTLAAAVKILKNITNYMIIVLTPWCRAALGITPCGTRTAAGGAVPGLG